jgi:hypothetical protein
MKELTLFSVGSFFIQFIINTTVLNGRLGPIILAAKPG